MFDPMAIGFGFSPPTKSNSESYRQEYFNSGVKKCKPFETAKKNKNKIFSKKLQL